MDCQGCKKPFLKQKGGYPRILMSCGHTMCEACIEANLHQHTIKCPECGEISIGDNFNNFPINANLLSLSQNNSSTLCQHHHQKLQAYCEKDHELLCMGCLINGAHKNHKIICVRDKVIKDRKVLTQCADTILQHQATLQLAITEQVQTQVYLENQYKDLLLEVGLFYRSVHEIVKELEEKTMNRMKREFEESEELLKRQKSELQEKHHFMHELVDLYDGLTNMSELEYLREENRRQFILKNCDQKKPKLDTPKLQFSKLQNYCEIISVLQEMAGVEKKMAQTLTPTLNKKKSKQVRKQPTILEVNLHDQYNKHYKNLTSHFQGNKSKKAKNNSVSNQTPRPKKKLSQIQCILPKSGLNEESIQISSRSLHSFGDSLQQTLVNSFMESNTSSLSIKDSQSDYTLEMKSQQIIHLGSYHTSSIEIFRGDNPRSVLMTGRISKSKFQCVVLGERCLLMGGKSSNDEKLKNILEYEIKNDRVSHCSWELSEGKSGFGAVVREQKIYIAGGSNSVKSLKSFEEYRVVGGELAHRQLPTMIFSRDQLGMALGFDDYLYVCGGINESGTVLSSCERYSWNKGKWQQLPNMKSPRRCFSLVALSHGIMAIGGYNGKKYLSSVELFSFKTNKWEEIAPMQKARFAHTAVLTHDFSNVIVSGGFNEGPLKSVEIWDAIEENWKPGIDLSCQRFLHGTILIHF